MQSRNKKSSVIAMPMKKIELMVKPQALYAPPIIQSTGNSGPSIVKILNKILLELLLQCKTLPGIYTEGTLSICIKFPRPNRAISQLLTER